MHVCVCVRAHLCGGRQTFLLSCLMTQLGSVSGGDGRLAAYGTLVNYALSGVFVVELGISLYAHWWRAFFTSGWKIFDLVIVALSLLTVTPWSPIPPEVSSPSPSARPPLDRRGEIAPPEPGGGRLQTHQRVPRPIPPPPPAW